MIIIKGRTGTGKDTELLKKFLLDEEDATLVIGKRTFPEIAELMCELAKRVVKPTSGKKNITNIDGRFLPMDFLRAVDENHTDNIYILEYITAAEYHLLDLEEKFLDREEMYGSTITIVQQSGRRDSFRVKEGMLQ